VSTKDWGRRTSSNIFWFSKCINSRFWFATVEKFVVMWMRVPIGFGDRSKPFLLRLMKVLAAPMRG
jgi:hypothetical protein